MIKITRKDLDAALAGGELWSDTKAYIAKARSYEYSDYKIANELYKLTGLLVSSEAVRQWRLKDAALAERKSE